MSTLLVGPNPRSRRAFGLLVASEARLARRRPAGLVVAVGVPLVLLVIFGSIPATTRAQAALGGISFFNLYVPSLLVFVLIAVGLGALPQQLAGYRQQGVLRRMSTTPVPPSWLLAAQLTVSMTLATIGIGILLGVGAAAFGLALPHTVGGYLISLVTLLLTAAATLALGLCAAALASTPQVASALTVVLFYPMAFFSGLYIPIQEIHSARGPGPRQGAADRGGIQRAARCVQRTLPGGAAAARARRVGDRRQRRCRPAVPLGMSRGEVGWPWGDCDRRRLRDQPGRVECRGGGGRGR